MARVNLGKDSSGRPLVVDDRTLAKLRLAEERLGRKFTIVQGSWRGSSGASASAGTHNRGGVIDLRTWNLADVSPQEAVRQLRLAGLIAWYRTKAQGFDPHIHAIDYGNPDLDPSAARQVAAWEQGRNGLASNGYDDGAKVPVPRDPPKPPPPPLEPIMPRRRKWLTTRRSRGLARPKPVTVVVANGMSASGVGSARTAGIVKRAAREADVLLLCEVSNVRLASVLDDFHVWQPGSLGSPESGSAVCVRKARGRIAVRSVKLGTQPFLGRRRADRMRTRSWAVTKVVLDPGTRWRWTHRYSAGHAPPKRNWFLWPTFTRSKPAGTSGADWNKRKPALVARYPGRTVRMIRLLGIVGPRIVPTSRAVALDVGGDHQAALITQWPTKEKS